ncbi:hypothetical protein GUITHDRAFT_99120 [Guillardia theta CCMP2712]|uniref:Uncharacterized protein n=2 Tax=Guillardia theta (strain CCMP2712) TaxID=905079 RepID=L1K428_GUITC|nr:hypothetical protein GUITHDRAFT_99120 [Guillardia theta CCMP2712]EKX55339.1 hypothetical protein GUITHDRAFT_99120 [Guillardia theta CCMP2712]|eukprot:XP_005842319.1 hypothetical protein GUITHDRAFT_99120 [Guillardia theta CCMP2712]
MSAVGDVGAVKYNLDGFILDDMFLKNMSELYEGILKPIADINFEEQYSIVKYLVNELSQKRKNASDNKVDDDKYMAATIAFEMIQYVIDTCDYKLGERMKDLKYRRDEKSVSELDKLKNLKFNLKYVNKKGFVAYQCNEKLEVIYHKDQESRNTFCFLNDFMFAMMELREHDDLQYNPVCGNGNEYDRSEWEHMLVCNECFNANIKKVLAFMKKIIGQAYSKIMEFPLEQIRFYLKLFDVFIIPCKTLLECYNFKSGKFSSFEFMNFKSFYYNIMQHHDNPTQLECLQCHEYFSIMGIYDILFLDTAKKSNDYRMLRNEIIGKNDEMKQLVDELPSYKAIIDQWESKKIKYDVCSLFEHFNTVKDILCVHGGMNDLFTRQAFQELCLPILRSLDAVLNGNKDTLQTSLKDVYDPVIANIVACIDGKCIQEHIKTIEKLRDEGVQSLIMKECGQETKGFMYQFNEPEFVEVYDLVRAIIKLNEDYHSGFNQFVCCDQGTGKNGELVAEYKMIHPLMPLLHFRFKLDEFDWVGLLKNVMSTSAEFFSVWKEQLKAQTGSIPMMMDIVMYPIKFLMTFMHSIVEPELDSKYTDEMEKYVCAIQTFLNDVHSIIEFRKVPPGYNDMVEKIKVIRQEIERRNVQFERFRKNFMEDIKEIQGNIQAINQDQEIEAQDKQFEAEIQAINQDQEIEAQDKQFEAEIQAINQDQEIEAQDKQFEAEIQAIDQDQEIEAQDTDNQAVKKKTMKRRVGGIEIDNIRTEGKRLRVATPAMQAWREKILKKRN